MVTWMGGENSNRDDIELSMIDTMEILDNQDMEEAKDEEEENVVIYHSHHFNINCTANCMENTSVLRQYAHRWM